MNSNKDVRSLLADRGIIPEALPAAEDIKKVERRVESERKTLPKLSDCLPAAQEENE